MKLVFCVLSSIILLLFVFLEQEALKGSPNHSTQSPEVTSKVAILNEEVNDTVKSLTEKLSAALVNVGAKEDLVKQHAKVAEEAVAGIIITHLNAQVVT